MTTTRDRNVTIETRTPNDFVNGRGDSYTVIDRRNPLVSMRVFARQDLAETYAHNLNNGDGSKSAIKEMQLFF